MVEAGFAADRPDEHAQAANGVVVTAAGPADVTAVVSLESRVRAKRMPSASLATAVADPERAVVLATSGAELVGWAKTHFWDWTDGPAEAGHYLGGVTVDAAWRRRGVAAALTQAG